MNYNSMSDFELLHYLDLYSDDPVIRRLVGFLSNTRGGLISDLEAVGMDPHTWQFETEWQHMYPGDYIQQLRSEVDEFESALNCANTELEKVTEERDELKTRTIMDFVQEALKETAEVKEQNAKLREQIDMWGRMTRVT